MAKTRRQKRGGAVQEGEYVYAVYIQEEHSKKVTLFPTAYKHLKTAFEFANEMYDKFQKPGWPRQVTFEESENTKFGTNDEFLFGRAVFSNIYIKRLKVTEKLDKKTGQRRAIGQVANKTGISPDTERNIAEMVGVRGL